MSVRGRTSSLSLDVGVTSVGRVLAFGISLVIPMVLTRVFSQTDYGIYRELSLLVLTLQPILLLGIPSSLRYFIPRSSIQEKRRYMTQTLVLSVGLGMLMFFILAFTGGHLTDLLYKDDLGEFMLVWAVHGLFFLVSSYIGIVMIVNDDINLASITAVAFSFLDVGFMCGAALWFRSITGLIVAIAAASIIKSMVTFIYIQRNFRPSLSFVSKAGMNEQLSFAVPIGLSDVINILNVNVDKFFIGFFLTTSQFAVYSIGAMITPMLMVISRSVFDIVTPEFSKLYKKLEFKELIALWHESMRKLALLFYPLTVILLIFAYEVITVLFTTDYAGAVPVFRIYLLMLPLNVTFFHGVLLAAGETKYLLKATTTIFVINIFLIYFMIVWFIDIGYELLGPPVATVAANIILRALWLDRISKVLKVPMSRVFPWGLMSKLMGVCLLAGGITVGIMFGLGINLFGDLITIPGGYEGIVPIFDGSPMVVYSAATALIGLAFYCGIYFILAKHAGLVRKGDLEIIWRFVGLRK